VQLMWTVGPHAGDSGSMGRWTANNCKSIFKRHNWLQTIVNSWIFTNQFTTRKEFPQSCRINNSSRYLQALCIHAQ
jgi:hypothetical protein